MIVNATGDIERRSNAEPVEAGDGLVMFTSGSSGTPKAAILTWDAIIASATLTNTALQPGNNCTWNACLPPSHIGGFAVLARSIFTDAAVLFGDTSDLADGATRGATHVSVVRTQLVRHDTSNYRVVLLGGSKPPERLASNVVTTWGMTETGSGIVYDAHALPGVELACVNGEMWVHSPTLFRAYRNAPSPFRTGPDGRHNWFATGDAGEITNDVVTIFGRQHYVIVTGGEKVWPEDLESLFDDIAGVTDLAVFGAKNGEWGQQVEALVVTTRRGDELREELNNKAATAFGPWAKIKRLHIVAAIPRSPSGKIQREQLAEFSQLTPPVD